MGLAAKNINWNILQFLNNSLDFQEGTDFRQVNDLEKAFLEDASKLAEEFQEFGMAWEASIFGELLMNNSNLISIKFSNEMFTGVAQGYQSTHYLIFGAKRGNKLKAADLFTGDFIEFGESEFRKLQNNPEDAGINSTRFFFEYNQFHLSENIGFYKKVAYSSL